VAISRSATFTPARFQAFPSSTSQRSAQLKSTLRLLGAFLAPGHRLFSCEGKAPDTVTCCLAQSGSVGFMITMGMAMASATSTSPKKAAPHQPISWSRRHRSLRGSTRYPNFSKSSGYHWHSAQAMRFVRVTHLDFPVEPLVKM